jgi:hypothetical protein
MDSAPQKTAKGVHATDLAAFIDARREAAQKQMEQIRSSR